jgi:hypothetical protein
MSGERDSRSIFPYFFFQGSRDLRRTVLRVSRAVDRAVSGAVDCVVSGAVYYAAIRP